MAARDEYFEISTPFGPPQGEAYSFDLVTARGWEQLAQVDGVVRVDTDTSDTQPKTFAVMPLWQYGRDAMRLADWHVRPCPGEEAAISDALATLQAELDETTDTGRKWELEQDIADLNTARHWREVANSFGDGCNALYRACATANVPYKLRSNANLVADRPFTLLLHRAKPQEGQEDCWVSLRFGHWKFEIRQESEMRLTRYKDGWYTIEAEEEPDWTLYGPVDKHSYMGLSAEGLKRYRYHIYGQDFDGISAFETYLQEVRDGGRMTAADRAQVKTWKDAVRDLKRVAKKAKRELTATEHGQIADYEKQITDLQESKRGGLNKAEADYLKATEAALIDFTTDVTFRQSAETTFNRDLALTFIPQRRGYVTIHCSLGDDYFVLEDESVTATGADSTEPIFAATPLEIEGNGGALWFRTSYIDARKYSIIKGRRAYAGHGVTGTASMAWTATAPAGTTILGTVTPAGEGGFDWQLEFTSDGFLLPVLYSVHLEVAPVARAAETVLLNSRNLSDVHWEVGCRHEEGNRGRAITLTMTAPNEVVAAFGLDTLAQHQIEVGGKEGAWFTGILQKLTSEAVGAHHTRLTWEGYDRWYLMRTARLYSGLIGDSKTLATYYRQCALGVGLRTDEVIISGAATERAIEAGRAGDDPAMRPEYGCQVADHLERLVSSYGYGLDQWFDGDGRLHLEPLGTVTRTHSYHLRSLGEWDRQYMRNVREETNFDDFCNDLTVTGATIRGERLSARYEDYSSVYDPASPRYVGRWLAGDVQSDEALRSQAAVTLALRWRVEREGKPKTYLSFETARDETLRSGDRFLCDGRACEAVEISYDDVQSDTMTLRVKVL